MDPQEHHSRVDRQSPFDKIVDLFLTLLCLGTLLFDLWLCYHMYCTKIVPVHNQFFTVSIKIQLDYIMLPLFCDVVLIVLFKLYNVPAELAFLDLGYQVSIVCHAHFLCRSRYRHVALFFVSQ